MDATPGSKSFTVTGDAYDLFMGRYGRPLASVFADSAGVVPGLRAVDVGCGPGALTSELVARLGAGDVVAACDPAPQFVAECARRHPGVDVRVGTAQAIPFADASFDRVLAQLVLHFVTDPPAAAAEFRRVARPGGIVAACVWDFAEGMELLRSFWDAALSVDRDAPDEARTLRFGRQGEIAELLDGAGFADIEETMLDVTSTYAGFDELWAGCMAGVGPAGWYLESRPPEQQAAIRHALFDRLGRPNGTFTLHARARSAAGRTPR